MRNFLDDFPQDWSNPEYRKLRDILVANAEADPRVIEELAKEAGISSGTFPRDVANTRDSASKLVEVMGKQGKLRKLVEVAVADEVHIHPDDRRKLQEMLSLPPPTDVIPYPKDEPLPLTRAELNALAELVERSGRADSSARNALCLEIGVDPGSLDFLAGTAAHAHAVQLVFHLHNTGDTAALLRLCDAIAPILKGQYAAQLAQVRAKLG